MTKFLTSLYICASVCLVPLSAGATTITTVLSIVESTDEVSDISLQPTNLVPGSQLKVISTDPEAIEFTYDNHVPFLTGQAPLGAKVEIDREMLERKTKAVSDLLAVVFTEGASLQHAFFFSDDEFGGGIPGTCTFSVFCFPVRPVIESGKLQRLFILNQSVGNLRLHTVYKAVSDVEAVPEPATLIPIGFGVAAVAMLRAKRSRSRAKDGTA